MVRTATDNELKRTWCDACLKTQMDSPCEDPDAVATVSPVLGESGNDRACSADGGVEKSVKGDGQRMVQAN